MEFDAAGTYIQGWGGAGIWLPDASVATAGRLYVSVQPRARRPRGDITVAVAHREGGERPQVEGDRRRWAERLSANGSLPLQGHGGLSLIHISEPTRLGMISYAVF